MRFGLTTPPTTAAAASSFAGLAVAPVNALRGAMAAALVFGSAVVTTPPAMAVSDGAAIGKCLFKKCPLPLARCVADPTCLANLACIQTCAANPETEGDCQIKCGDEFSNDVVGDFTKCAVTDGNCVPQRQDDNSWPVPPDSALVKEFSTDMMTGPWYISAGLNKAFDTFDCQLHKFEAPTPTKLVGNLQWRIKDPLAGTQFVTRYTVQEFVQDSVRPGIMYNHDNEFLHYQDDWYILAQKPNEYILIYYRGSNDAWDGYGGATVYSKEPTLNPKYFKEIDEALMKVGRRWSEFTLTDNSCKAAETRLEEIENDLVFVEGRVATGIQTAETKIVKEIQKDLVAAEKEVEKDIKLVAKEVKKDLVAVEKEIEKDVVGVEKEVEKDIKGLFKR